MLGIQSRRPREVEDYKNENGTNDTGKNLKDQKNNETIRKINGIERWEEFLREQRLRLLGYVVRMDEESGL